jgi:nitrogen regulatory protein PII
MEGKMAEIKAKFDLIVTIVSKGFATDVVNASKKAGAEGGTIIHGRGTGVREDGKIFGIPIEPEKEIVLTLIEQKKTEEVLKDIEKELCLDEPGKGIVFVLDVKSVAGICHLCDLDKDKEKGK